VAEEGKRLLTNLGKKSYSGREQMKRILITGMSGTGKSTVIEELRARGYRAVDMDEPGWSEYAGDGDWIWHEDRVQELLSSLEDGDVLFISGCASNQGKFYPQLDEVILFSAPTEIIVERLKTRTNNPYGKDPQELSDTLSYIETVEPLLRKGADHEIDTSAPLQEVVAEVLIILETT
jgi:dephospho-CoA kinase